MLSLDNNTQAFLALVRAGLWENDVQLEPYGDIDFNVIYRLAQEQSVVGLVAAGLEHVRDVPVPKDTALSFAGEALQLEQRNSAMNSFIGIIVEKLRAVGIFTLLVKGQGIAQCYERPLWRSAGDIDFYLSKSNYEKAKALLTPLAQSVETEDKERLHFGLVVDGWVVELHGTLHTYISRRINKVSDEVHHNVFYNGNIRSWDNNGVQVFLPSPDNDVIIIFNHFVNHFYGEGIGLRQICDWCRLLWKYRDLINHKLLETRIYKAGLTTEWKAFAAFVVEYLGMQDGAMPIYSKASYYGKTAKKICKLFFETGSFGIKKNKDYRKTTSTVKRNISTFWVRLMEFARLTPIFPVNAPKFFFSYVFNRAKAII